MIEYVKYQIIYVYIGTQLVALLFGILPQDLVVATGHMEGVQGIGAHVQNAYLAPRRLCETCLELGVHRIDLPIRAIFGEQRLRKEAREAVQRTL